MLARRLFAAAFIALMLLGLAASVLASPSPSPVWEPTATVSENTTLPTGLTAPVARENTGAENTAVITGAAPIVANVIGAVENVIDTTRMPAPAAQVRDGKKVDNKDNLAAYGITAASIPFSENRAIPMRRVTVAKTADNWYYENLGPVTLRGRSGWIFRVDNFDTASYDDLYIRDPETVWRTAEHALDATGKPTAAGLLIGTAWSVDANSFFENLMFRHAENAVESGAPPPLDITVFLRADSWVIAVGENALRVDLDNTGTIDATDNLHAIIADDNSDGLMDRVYFSAGTSLAFNDPSGDDGVVTAVGLNDENVRIENVGVRVIRIGLREYKFKVTLLDAEAPRVAPDVAITINSYYTRTLSIDVDDNAIADVVWFCFVDSDSNGIYENIYISAGNDNFLEGLLTDVNVRFIPGENNDERITVAKNIRIGSYLYRVEGPNPPGGPPVPDDISVFSLTRWVGIIFLDTDRSGVADNAVRFCLTDNDSNGVFDVLGISSEDDVFGENWTTDSAYGDNDLRTTLLADNIRIGVSAGVSYRYRVEFVRNPAATGWDVRVTSTCWYPGTIALVWGKWRGTPVSEDIKFVLWDNNSDGVFESLTFDTDKNDSYSGENRYTVENLGARVALPRESRFVYSLQWFDNTPSSVALRLRPVDVTAPREVALSETPKNFATLTERKPTISIKLRDHGNDGVVFDIDEDSIALLVNGVRVRHSYDYTMGMVSYTPARELPLGGNTVEVRVSDLARNSYSWGWSFSIASPLVLPTPEPTIEGVEIPLFVGLMAAAAAAVAILIAVVGRAK